MARPSKYLTHVAPRFEEIQDWVRNGATDEEICKKLRIARSTFCEYKNEFSEFSDALKKGKDFVDAQVESALLKRALGYDYIETTQEITADGKQHIKKVTKHMAPDTTAQIFWLKNRRPEKWREKPSQSISDETSESVGVTINIKDCSKDDA